VNSFSVAVISGLVMLFSALQVVKQSKRVPQGKVLMVLFGLLTLVSFVVVLGATGLA